MIYVLRKIPEELRRLARGYRHDRNNLFAWRAPHPERGLARLHASVSTAEGTPTGGRVVHTDTTPEGLCRRQGRRVRGHNYIAAINARYTRFVLRTGASARGWRRGVRSY
jgi:hypothetical protein